MILPSARGSYARRGWGCKSTYAPCVMAHLVHEHLDKSGRRDSRRIGGLHESVQSRLS
jgi:hypothetical protein